WIKQGEMRPDRGGGHAAGGVDVTGIEQGSFEIEPIVGRIAWHLARIEGAAAGASNITAGAELPCQLAAQNSCGGGAVLQRSSIVIELDEFREQSPDFIQQRRRLGDAVRMEITRDAAP